MSQNINLWQPLFFVLIYVSRDKWDVNLCAIRKTKFSKKYTSAFCDLLCLSNVLQSAIVCPCEESTPFQTFRASLTQMVKALTDTKLKAEVHFKKTNVFLIKLSNLHPIIIVTHILNII